MGICRGIQIKAESQFHTGGDAKYVSRDGNDIYNSTNKGSSTSTPAMPRSEGEILQSSNLKSFTFSELKNSTRNFRPDSVLGEGSFGSVFKGWVDEQSLVASKPGSRMVIAVKRLNQEGFQGRKEWLAEINYLGQLSHPNLVKLIGYCLEDDHRLLVYEYMQNRSMENHLNCNAKLSDFGLARDGPIGDKSPVSTRVMGTYGSAGQEYLSAASEHSLVEWATPYLNNKRRIFRVLNARLEGQYLIGRALKAANLALQCLCMEPKLRLSMDEFEW